jgi:hypothetical protein
MKEVLLTHLLPSIMYLVVTLMVGFVAYYAKLFLITRMEVLEHQRQELIQKIGIDKYNHEANVAWNIVNAIEQEARELNWDKLLKKSIAVDRIEKQLDLTSSKFTI